MEGKLPAAKSNAITAKSSGKNGLDTAHYSGS